MHAKQLFGLYGSFQIFQWRRLWFNFSWNFQCKPLVTCLCFSQFIALHGWTSYQYTSLSRRSYKIYPVSTQSIQYLPTLWLVVFCSMASASNTFHSRIPTDHLLIKAINSASVQLNKKAFCNLLTVYATAAPYLTKIFRGFSGYSAFWRAQSAPVCALIFCHIQVAWWQYGPLCHSSCATHILRPQNLTKSNSAHVHELYSLIEQDMNYS